MKNTNRRVHFIFLLTIMMTFPAALWSQEEPPVKEEPTLVKAVMCESIQKFSPVNEAFIFSIELGRIHSFTEFDPVPKQTVVFHKWYHKGSLVSVKQLTVNPPRWSIFSSIQLRDADKGPWQVDIMDSRENLLRTLRFSITD